MAKPRAPQRMTTRERACQKVARGKAVRKWAGGWWRRIKWTALLALCFSSFAIGGWYTWTGKTAQTFMAMRDGLFGITAQAGFRLQALYIEGRKRTSMAEIQEALDVGKGTPMLAVSLVDMQTRLEAVSTIKHVAIERALPDTLHIHITEREPVAIWQSGGKLSLVDEEGVVMKDRALKDYVHLPLIIGKGAPSHIKEALSVVSAVPELSGLIKAAVRVGDRRWNIRLKQGVDVKLPEENPLEAWRAVGHMVREQHIFERAITSIDLRDPSQAIFTVTPAPSVSPVGARET